MNELNELASSFCAVWGGILLAFGAYGLVWCYGQLLMWLDDPNHFSEEDERNQ